MLARVRRRSLEDHRQVVGGLLVDLVGSLAAERAGAVRQVRMLKPRSGLAGALKN